MSCHLYPFKGLSQAADGFQHPGTAQLSQHVQGIQLVGPFVAIGLDATDIAWKSSWAGAPKIATGPTGPIGPTGPTGPVPPNHLMRPAAWVSLVKILHQAF